MVPLMASVSGWFRRRLGLGIGILWAAGGIGTAAFAPIAGLLIETVGWQGNFLVIGLIGGAAMLGLVPFMRNRPSDLGIEPYGARPGDSVPVKLGQSMERLRIKTFNQHIRKTRPFWNLPLIHGLGCAGHGIILIYVAKYAIDSGVFTSLAAAGIILAIISLVSIISRFGTPVLAEIYGTRRMMAVSLAIQGLTVPIIMFGPAEPWLFYLFAVTFGIGFGGEWTGYLIINRQYYGDGPMGDGVRLADNRRADGALCGHCPGRADHVHHRFVPRRPRSLHGLQPGRRGGDLPARQQLACADTRLGKRATRRGAAETGCPHAARTCGAATNGVPGPRRLRRGRRRLMNSWGIAKCSEIQYASLNDHSVSPPQGIAASDRRR